MAFFKRNIDILLILLVGFLLRFSISFIHSYSNDELSAVSRLRYSNVSDLLEFGVMKGDMHPAGVQFFMKGWSLIFGKSELAMRFPFVLFGTASIFMLFLIGKQWFNRKVGLIAAGLLAVLYFPIMNSEFARPYSPGLLISLLVGYFLYRVVFDDQKQWRNAIVLGFLFAAGMYTHYFAFLFVGLIGATGLLYLNKTNWKFLLLSGAIGIALFIPHIAITQFHLSVGGLQWLPEPGPLWLIEFLFHAFNESWLVLLPVFTLVIWALTIKKWEPMRSRNVWLITLWFFGVYAAGFVLSYVSTPVLKFPVMLFAFPYFLLLLALLLARLPKTNLILAGLMAVVLISTLAERKLYGNQHYALFRETGIRIAEWREKYGAEHIYTVYNLNNPDYMNFYVDDWGGDSIQFDWSIIEFDSDIQLRRDLLDRQEEYCVLGFSSRLTLVQVFETVREFYPVVVDYLPCNNGNVFLMKRGVESAPFVQALKFADLNNFKNENWEVDATQLATENTEKVNYTLDSTHIFGPTFRFNLTDLPAIEHGYIKVIVSAELEPGAEMLVTFSGNRDGESIQHRGENMWMGHHLEEMILNSKQQEGYFAFEIPDFLLDTDELKIGLWNLKATNCLITQFEIFFVENKWN